MLFIVRVYYDTDERYGDYPDFIIAIGWTSLALCVLPIPVMLFLNRNVCHHPTPRHPILPIGNT